MCTTFGQGRSLLVSAVEKPLWSCLLVTSPQLLLLCKSVSLSALVRLYRPTPAEKTRRSHRCVKLCATTFTPISTSMDPSVSIYIYYVCTCVLCTQCTSWAFLRYIRSASCMAMASSNSNSNSSSFCSVICRTCHRSSLLWPDELCRICTCIYRQRVWITGRIRFRML